MVTRSARLLFAFGCAVALMACGSGATTAAHSEPSAQFCSTLSSLQSGLEVVAAAHVAPRVPPTEAAKAQENIEKARQALSDMRADVQRCRDAGLLR